MMLLVGMLLRIVVVKMGKVLLWLLLHGRLITIHGQAMYLFQMEMNGLGMFICQMVILGQRIHLIQLITLGLRIHLPQVVIFG